MKGNSHGLDAGRRAVSLLRSPVAPRSVERLLLRLLVWRDATLALGFFLLTVQLRRPFKMLVPYAWDSVLYIRAAGHFNATIHQPQPPGYLFYVSAGRLFDLAVRDTHRALIWVSILAAGVAVAALYLLVRLLYDWVTGAIAAGLLMTSVTFWFYSEIAYPYTTLAAGSTVLALLALAVRRGSFPGARGVALVTLAFGLISGFRQDLLLFSTPLFIVALWGRPARHWVVAAAAGALGILVWLLPTAALSEGMTKYLGATFRQGSAASGDAVSFATGLVGLQDNAREVAIFLWRGLYLAVPPLGYFLLRRLLSRPRRWTEPALLWVLLWLIPPLLFYVLAHVGDYGYTFSVLPGLLALAARGVVLGTQDLLALGAALGRRWRPGLGKPRTALASAALALLPLLAGAILAAGDASLFLWRKNQFSVAGIACFDATMHERVRLVRQAFLPQETLIFSAGYYQHVRIILPQYQTWLYTPSQGPQAERALSPETRYLVIFDEAARPEQLAGFERFTLPCNGAPFYYTSVRDGDVVRFDATAQTVAVQRRSP